MTGGRQPGDGGPLRFPWSAGSGSPRALVRIGAAEGAALTERPERERWWRFERPVEVLRADRLEQVSAVLAGVEAGARRGLWAVGFVTYEAAPAFDPAFRTHPPSPGLPLAWFGLFPAPTVLRWRAPGASSGAAFEGLRDLAPTVSERDYLQAVRTVREHIALGDTYQANLTYRLRGQLAGRGLEAGAQGPAPPPAPPPSPLVDPPQVPGDGGTAEMSLALPLFGHLATLQAGAYATLLELDDLAICSASPELFFERTGPSVVCRPMKGTAPRGRSAAEDRAAAAALRSSPKERAENLMIVDMIRNDLGRVARTGSVAVRELFRIERYPTLFQMTSEIEATTDAPLPALFEALFPCASITGAPKVRTMEILASLETTARGVYTGALGFVTPGRDARFSVAIRTAVVRKESVDPAGKGTGGRSGGRSGGRVAAFEYGIGSGIVWDSVPERELEETRAKALNLVGTGPTADGNDPGQAFSLLETVLWRAAPEGAGARVAGGSTISPSPFDLPSGAGLVLREHHLERLARSAEALGFPLDLDRVRAQLEASGRRLASLTTPSDHRLRLLVNRSGVVTIQEAPLRRAPEPWTVALADEPVDETDPRLVHKTTRRELYETALAQARGRAPAVDDVVLWNRAGELTETTLANLAVELDGVWLTPAKGCGLLPGTFRAELLARGVLREARLPRGVLARATRIALVNSVRGWVPARLSPRLRTSAMPRHGRAG